MGACDFFTAAEGPTMAAAFNAAVDQARYEYGSAGYTGTIAEKRSYVELVLPTGVSAEDAYGALSGWYDDADLGEPMGSAIWRRTVTLATTQTVHEQVPVNVTPSPPDTNLKRGWNADMHAARLVEAGKWELVEVKPPPEYMVKAAAARTALQSGVPIRMLTIARQSHNDKWGPAVGIQTGPGTFVFCGTASM